MLTLSYEKRLWEKGYDKVVGIDEAGRGALAGPVVATAVLLKKENMNKQKTKEILKLGIKDSKELSPLKREEIYNYLNFRGFEESLGIDWSVSFVSAKVIDRINILVATKLAMQRAISNLERNLYKKGERGKVEYAIIDGNFSLGKTKLVQESIKQGDKKVFSCALSSIISKVKRDKLMENYHKKYPQYNFHSNKGYGSKYHLSALSHRGGSRIHRKSFSPLKNLQK